MVCRTCLGRLYFDQPCFASGFETLWTASLQISRVINCPSFLTAESGKALTAGSETGYRDETLTEMIPYWPDRVCSVRQEIGLFTMLKPYLAAGERSFIALPLLGQPIAPTGQPPLIPGR